jgi:stearoyl-CoA desaturase (delta-9 desaturase)
VDHEELDPYSISKGFWYAHMGWLLFKLYPSPPLDNVNDLRKDPIVMWQHNHVQTIAVFVSFILPFYIGYAFGGILEAWGAFLIAGLLRVVVVQHGTFFINSACHYFGSQPYSTRCSARDSWFMAIFTYGEGYHNYHHEFQHDYRNGVQPWQLDPTKWLIWTLDKVGLVSNLRRVEDEKIILSQLVESHRKLNEKIEKKNATLPAETQTQLSQAQSQLDQASNQWTELKNAYATLKHQASESSHEKLDELNREIKKATDHLHQSIKQWKKVYRVACTQV